MQLYDLKTMDEIMLEHKYPILEKVNDISFSPLDVVVLAAGFEDRSLFFLNKIISKLDKTNKVIVVEYLPNNQHNHLTDIIELCETHNISYESLVYDRHSPFNFNNLFCQIIKDSYNNIYLDISGMSRLLIVQVIVAIRQIERFINTSLIYTEAACYHPMKKDVLDALSQRDEDILYKPIFLSTGVYEIVIPPELSSISLLGRPIRLIASPDFNTDQLSVLRSEIQPSYMEIINGVPLRKKNEWRLEALRSLNSIDKLKIQKNEYQVSTFDYREALMCFLKIYHDNNVFDRIVISPTGSKLQAVAIGIFRAYLDDIQVVYPVPNVFPEVNQYTSGCTELYKLNLFSLSEIDKLQS